MFTRASRPNSGCISGDFHVSSSLSFQDLSQHSKVSDWLNLQGYYMVLCDCQSSDMIPIGFLSRVRPFTRREDLSLTIHDSSEWISNPFHFCLYPGSISCNKKGSMAPVLMVDIEWNAIPHGLDYFCKVFEGENPLSPCDIPYLFLTLYQNQFGDEERLQIIQDINHHIGQVSLLYIHGLQDIDNLVTLKQNIVIKLRKLLLGLRAVNTTNRLFVQIERTADVGSYAFAYYTVDYDSVTSNMHHLSALIRQCIIENDHFKVFMKDDFSLSFSTKGIPIKKGNFQVSSKPVPVIIQEHTSLAFSKMVATSLKRPSSKIQMASAHFIVTLISPTA
jgi:hypothetical protein